jgi:hypothetical protein
MHVRCEELTLEDFSSQYIPPFGSFAATGENISNPAVLSNTIKVVFRVEFDVFNFIVVILY